MSFLNEAIKFIIGIICGAFLSGAAGSPSTIVLIAGGIVAILIVIDLVVKWERNYPG